MRHTTKLVSLLAALSAQLALAASPPPAMTAAPPDPATARGADGPIQAAPADGGRRNLSLAEPAEGPASGGRKTVFKLHPVPMVGSMVLSLTTPDTLLTLPLEMEYAMTSNLSLYWVLAPTLLETRRGSGGGLGMNGGARVYLFGGAPDGFWLGGQVGATVLQGGGRDGVFFDLQPQIGYQWVLKNGLTVGLGGGLSVSAAASGQLPLTFLVPIGYAW